MMKQLGDRVAEAVDHELMLARKDHGYHFASVHEGYGVIAEKLMELCQAVDDVINKATELLQDLHDDDNGPLPVGATAEKLMDAAKCAACEAIQVAAMGRKLSDTMMKKIKEEH